MPGKVGARNPALLEDERVPRRGGNGEKTRALEALRAALLRTRVQVGISEISAGRSRVPLLSEGGWTGAAVRPVRQMQHALPGDEGDTEEEEEEDWLKEDYEHVMDIECELDDEDNEDEDRAADVDSDSGDDK